MDKWAEYKKHFCTCKDAHRYNSCKGLLTCSLHANNPERKHITFTDLKEFWNGRPKRKGMVIHSNTIYPFGKGWRLGFVYVHPTSYRPIDWRGLI